MTFWLTFSRWCGFGIERDLFPEIRCGWVRCGWVKGALKDKLDATLVALGLRA